ncbi:MAG: sulfurtransferase TusA family protein [Thermoleophilia bacterium]|jgi:cysteine desulfurase|nr:sulfurtransferase TusA family protein [Thermoleophilia bacterium]
MTGAPVLVDALGTWCPVPVSLTARAITRVPTGGLVEVWADDPLVAVDLPAWCHRTGHALERMDEEAGRWRALVRRTR